MVRIPYFAVLCLLLAGCGDSAVTAENPPSEAARSASHGSNSSQPGNFGDWPRFLGPNSDGKSPEQGIATAWPEDGPPIVFQLALGEGYPTVAVSDGKLYVFDRVENKARLRCCNSRTGKELWKFTYTTDYRDLYGYDGGPRCQPIVDGERIHIYGVEGILHCLNTDGELIWKRDINDEYDVVQNFFGVGSCPFVYEDLLIVMVGGADEASQRLPPGALDRVRGNGSGLVAFDKNTGEEKWRLSDELASYSSPVVQEIGGQPLGLAFTRGGLLGFEPSAGKQKFFFPWRSSKLESANASNPVVVDNKVFLSETYGPGSALLEIEDGDYEVVWKDDPRSREKAMQTHWNTAVHVDGYLYGSSGRHRGDAELRCIELATGRLQWSQPGLTRSSLLYVDGHFVCLSEDGMLRLLEATPNEYRELAAVRLRDPESGAPLLEYPAWAAPVLSHGLLYVRGRDRLVCLRLIDEPR